MNFYDTLQRWGNAIFLFFSQVIDFFERPIFDEVTLKALDFFNFDIFEEFFNFWGYDIYTFSVFDLMFSALPVLVIITLLKWLLDTFT